MSETELRNLLRSAPFRPFAIHLADGRAVRVHHPELIIISPVGRDCIVYQPDGAFNVIDLRLVTDLEVGPPAPAAMGGQSVPE
jgi:hypothetical protein